MTEEEYYAEFERAGLQRTGERTVITEEWVDGNGHYYTAPDPAKLCPQDRKSSIERMKRYLGIGYPIGGCGVH